MPDDLRGRAKLVYDDRPTGAYDVTAFGRVTILVASDRQRAWALCQQGWADDGCHTWAAAMGYLDQYGLADVTVAPEPTGISIPTAATPSCCVCPRG